MIMNKACRAVAFATIAHLTTSVASADKAEFQQGVGGYTGVRDVEIRGGKAIPDPAPKDAPKKAETPKKAEVSKKAEAPKKDEAPKKAEAPKATDGSISVDLDNDGHQSQSLIRFEDIIGDGPGKIPAGSTVTAAVLTFSGNNAGGGKIYVHRVLVDWDPANLTWDAAKLGENTEGGIQDDEKEATKPFTSFASNRKGTFEVDVLPAVKLWVSGEAKNHGLVLTSDNGNGWDFDTSEAEATEKRPKLTVTFTPPAGSR